MMVVWSPGLALRRHAHRHNAVGVCDRLAALDLVDMLHAFDNLAPDRILPVEKTGISKTDEKLAVGGIRIRRPRCRLRRMSSN